MEKAKMIVQCKNLNNSATTCLFHPVRSAIERYTPVDEIQVLYHQNPAGIAEDTIIRVIIIQTQFHHTIMVVVTNADSQRSVLLRSFVVRNIYSCNSIPSIGSSKSDQYW
jgi:hypothetical protein